MKTDSLFYRIFVTSPAAFFDLIGFPNPNAADYRFTSEEVKQTSFRIDGIFTPPPHSPHMPLYFIEVMGYRDRKGDLYPILNLLRMGTGHPLSGRYSTRCRPQPS